MFCLVHTIFRLILLLSVKVSGEGELVDATLATQSGISTRQIKGRHAKKTSKRPWDVKVKETETEPSECLTSDLLPPSDTSVLYSSSFPLSSPFPLFVQHIMHTRTPLCARHCVSSLYKSSSTSIFNSSGSTCKHFRGRLRLNQVVKDFVVCSNLFH